MPTAVLQSHHILYLNSSPPEFFCWESRSVFLISFISTTSTQDSEPRLEPMLLHFSATLAKS